MKVMGIDPGLKGGISFYDGTNIVAYYTPVLEEEFVKKGKKTKRNIMDLVAICDLIDEHQPEAAVLEKVAARSGQGVTSMFRFGMGFGEFRGILSAKKIKFVEATPQAWKKQFGLSSEKNASLEAARELWPDKAQEYFRLKKQDGVAEAALIAKFGFDNPAMFD